MSKNFNTTVSTCYQVDKTKVVSEIIDGEAIIINLEKGYYYSLNPTGTFIWSLLRKRPTVQELLAATKKQLDSDSKKTETKVFSFLTKLKKEELILEGPVYSSEKQMPSNDVGESILALTKQFSEEPKIEKFEDMREFLLVDPIHEVDESGWPNVIESAE